MKMLYYKLRRTFRELSRYRVSLYAANAAFYMILAVFPTLMLLVGLLPVIGYGEADLLHAMEGLVPQVLYPLFERVITDMSANSTGALLSVTALVAIWSSSRSVNCIHLGLNRIYGLKENRPYLIRRLTEMLYMLFLLAALLLTLVAHGFGQEIATFCEGQTVPILRLVARILQFRGLILLILLTTLFTAIFCTLPNKKLHIRSAFPGAALAALGWLVFTRVFSYYARISNSYSTLYGSLSTIAMGMFWLYICLSILFYGSVLNLRLERRK